MKNIVVWGMGISGRACAEYFLKKNQPVIALEKNWSQHELQIWKEHMKSCLFLCEQDDAAIDLSKVESLIVSPGVSRDNPFYKKCLQENIPILSDVEIGIRETKATVIGITGTNGKTTLTAFITHLLLESGFHAKALGNIGTPLTQELLSQSPAPIWVCELSSYQLETLSSQNIALGIILDITPDHMDRYENFKSYGLAKLNLFRCLKKKALGIVTAKAWNLFKDDILSIRNDIIKIPSEFNYENKNCYLQLTKNKEYCDFLPIIREKAIGLELLFIGKKIADEFGISSDFLLKALSSFTKPSHRLEWVATIDGVSFINDSKATNVESVIYAVTLLSDPILLIAGGKDKELSYEPWIEAFASKVKKIFLIGECKEKIYKTLEGLFEIELSEDLEEATKKALAFAKPLTYVLLSPGCSSFDQFKDYKHRGETFKEIVLGLKKGS